MGKVHGRTDQDGTAGLEHKFACKYMAEIIALREKEANLLVANARLLEKMRKKAGTDDRLPWLHVAEVLSHRGSYKAASSGTGPLLLFGR